MAAWRPTSAGFTARAPASASLAGRLPAVRADLHLESARLGLLRFAVAVAGIGVLGVHLTVTRALLAVAAVLLAAVAAAPASRTPSSPLVLTADLLEENLCPTP